jgi:hypothetical protein
MKIKIKNNNKLFNEIYLNNNNNNNISDLKIINNEKEYYCHKIIFYLNSNYFKKLFEKETNLSEIIIKDEGLYEDKYFIKIIETFYNNSVDINSIEEFKFYFSLLIQVIIIVFNIY